MFTSEKYQDTPLWDRGLDLDSTLHQVFEAQVARTPNAVAAVDINGEWTYKELDECANVIAHRLVKQGVLKDKLVAIYLEKSVVYIAACIAANKAQGGFLPLELAFPRDQLNSTLADAGPTSVITDDKRKGNIDQQTLLVLGTDKSWYQSASVEERSTPPHLPTEQRADRESLCFVVYSSGTTGAPKGIVNPHRAPVMSYAWRFAIEPYPEPIVDHVRVACNVFFIWECFRPLLKGAVSVVIPDSVIYNVPELVKFLAKYKVTETLMTPSLLDTVLNMVPSGSLHTELPDLQVLWLNGEVTTAALCKRAIEALPGRRIWNLYSISETHEVSALELSAWYREHKGPTLPKYCPTGSIMPFMQVHILNEDHEPLAEGTAGEVWLSGPLLARGYLKRPDLTAARFAPNPFHQGEIMYRTGDLGLLRDGDNLKVLARVDHIVKIRGYSVGVGVVEAALLRALRINSVAVVADGEEGEDKRLVAYIVPASSANESGDPPSPRSRFPQADWAINSASWMSAPIRQVLKEHLAHYMIPSLYKVVDVLPIKATSGKLDKSQLPTPPPRSAASSCNALSDQDLQTMPRDQACIHIWQDILQLDPGVVTIDSDFFDLGGHSLTMTRTLQRMKSILGVNVAMDDFFAEPTIAGCLSKEHHHVRQAIDYASEAVLPPDIQPRAPATAPVQSLRDCRTILLTGAAGFVGTFLLQELLSQTDARVYCLVRRKNDQLDRDRGLQEGGTRIPHTNEEARQMFSLRDSITKNFATYRMKSTHINRVIPILGDLSKPRLGLTEPDFAKLGQEVDVIYHVGAAVNLMLPYSQLKATNVGGTREIIRLACMRQDVRVPLHFVSTNGFLLAAGERITEDLDIASISSKVSDGYSQSKLVAELLVHEAGRRGVPYTCIRPGNISGDSGTGGTNPLDYQFLIIRAAIDLGYAPILPGWRFEMTPIDFVVNTMISVAKREEYLGKVYHLINTHELINAKDIFEWVAQCGYALQSEPYEEWLARLSRHPKHGDLVAFLNVIGHAYLQQTVDTDTTNTDKVVHDYLLCRPVINSNLIALYLRYFHENGQIQTSTTEAERLVHHPLQGKVAVVTGASGGIGAAIAQGLAQAGAKVAMAARSIDKMEHVRDTILRAEPGASIITVRTDVTVREQVKDLIRETERQLGPVDILVNNAGVMYYTLMSTCEENHWETTVDVVCKGTLHGIGAVLQGMLTRNSGHIVNISSDAGRKVFPGLSVYSGAKFFVEAVSQGLRLETAATKLRVTTIQPGNVATDLAAMATDAEAIKQYGEPSGEKVLEPRDIARAVLYAVTQPEYVAVNEVLVEPSGEPA